jgi:predicted ATPase
LVDSLKRFRRLLILDNCEYVADGVAALAIGLLRETECRLLVTSLAPLGTDHEFVRRLEPLGMPAEGEKAVSIALQAPAVQLFIDCVRKGARELVLDADNIDAVVQICRHLEGIPLALELAVARPSGGAGGR